MTIVVVLEFGNQVVWSEQEKRVNFRGDLEWCNSRDSGIQTRIRQLPNTGLLACNTGISARSVIFFVKFCLLAASFIANETRWQWFFSKKFQSAASRSMNCVAHGLMPSGTVRVCRKESSPSINLIEAGVWAVRGSCQAEGKQESKAFISLRSSAEKSANLMLPSASALVGMWGTLGLSLRKLWCDTSFSTKNQSVVDRTDPFMPGLWTLVARCNFGDLWCCQCSQFYCKSGDIWWFL